MAMPGLPNPAMKHGDSGVWIGKSKITTVDEGGTPVQQELTYPVEASTALKKITPKIITTTTYGPDVYDGHLASPVVYAYLGEHVWVRDGLSFDIYQYDPDTSDDYMGVTPSGKYQGLDYIAIVGSSNIPEEYAASVAASGLRENWFIVKLNGAGDYNTLKALACDPFTNLANGSLAFVYPQSYTQSDLAGNKILDAYGQPKVFFGSVPTDSTAIYDPYVYAGVLVRSKSNFTPLYSTESNYSNINSNNLYSHQVNQWAQGEEIITTSTVLETEITGYTNLENTVSNFSKDTIREYQDQARNGRNEAERNAALAWLNHNVKQTSKTPYNKKTSDIRNQYTDLEGETAVDYYNQVAKQSTSEASRLAATAWLAKYAETPGYMALFSTPTEGKITYSETNKVAGIQGSEAIDYYTQVAKKSTSEASRLAAKAWLARYAETPGYETKKESPTPAMITLSTELGDDIIVTPTKNTSSEEWINILKAASELNGIDGMQGEEAVRFYELMKKYAPNYLNQKAGGSWLSRYAGTPGHPLYDEDAYEKTAFDYKGIIYDSGALFDTGEFKPLATSLLPKTKYRQTATQEEGMTKAEMIKAQEAVDITPVTKPPKERSWFDSYFQTTGLYSMYKAGSWVADQLGFQDEYTRAGQITYDFAKQKVDNINVQNVGDKITQTAISVSPLGPMFATADLSDLSKNLTGKSTDLITVTKSDLREARNELSSIETGIKNQETVVTSLEPQASKMQSELQTIYDKNVKDGVWTGSEADLQKFNQLSTEYAPTLEKYNDEVKKYDSIIAEYTKQEKNYTDLSQKHTDELNDSSLLMGWYNTFSKNITPTVRDWARSATVDYLMVPTKNVLDAPSNALSVVGDITGSKEIKSAANIVKKGTDTIWHNDYNVSVYDFLYYGVRPIPEFASEIIGTTPAAIEYAYENPTDFASLFPAKLAEEAVGTGTYAVEHPAAFFGMLAVPTAVKGVKAVPRTLGKLSPGYDRTPVWAGRYSLTDAVRGKATYGTWWEQYRQAQPPFREAMSNSLIDPFLATDILTGKKSVTRALSDVWKAGDGPGLKEYISPNRWKTTHYTPQTSAKQMVELADTPTPRIEYSQFYDSKHPLGPEMVETRATSFGDHATGNVFAESSAIEGKLTINSGKSSLLESGLFLGVEKPLAPFLEHAYPAVMRVKAPVWEYSQKIRDLVKKAEEYDSDISLLEKKLKKKGLSDTEALKLVELTAERARVEKALQKQVDTEFAAAPENVLIPGPKPTSRRAYHGELQEEFILKDRSQLFRAENWRTQLYDKFGLTRGTKYGYDPKSLQKYEIFEFTTEKPKTRSQGEKPSVWFDIPEFQKNLFYTPAYRSLIYGIRGVKSAIESPVRQYREARAEREILSKIDDPETRAAAKATIDTIRDIRGMKSAINLDIDLAALKEVGPELAGPLSELFQKHRVVMYGSGVNLATIPKERLWRELKDADLFIPREEAASFLVDAKKMFKKLGWDVKQDGLQVLSKEGRHLLDIHEAPVDYPLIGGTAMRRDPYTIEDQTPIAADYMPTRLETGEVFVRESLVTQASRKLNSMLDQFYEGKFKPNRAKDYPDGILSVEELLDFAEGKIDPNFFKAGYEKAKTITEQSRWEKLADLYSEVKHATIDKRIEAKIQRIRQSLEIIKNHSYVKPLYEAALKKGALYRLNNFEQLLREVNEAEFGMGILRERGGYLDLETGLSRLSKIGDEGEAAVSFMFDEAGIKPSETGSILDYHTHPLGGIMGRYDIFSIQDLKSFLYTDVKQGSVVTGGETYLFTKGPKTQAKIDRIINNRRDPFTGENIHDFSPAEKLSKYIDGLTDTLRKKQTQAMYEEALKAEPKLTKKQFLSRVNSDYGRYAHYKAILYNRVVKDIAKDLGCKVEEGGFSQAMSRTNLIWDDSTLSIAERELGSERMAPTVSDMDSSPRALINVGYAPYPSRRAGRGTGVSPAITRLMQASVFGGNYMQQTLKPIAGEKTFGKITYDVAKPADSRSAAREIQDVMTSTIDLTKPLTRYDTAPKIAKTRRPTKHSTTPKQQQTETSPSIYPARTPPVSRRSSITPYSYDQTHPRPSSPRIVVNYSHSDPRRGRDLSYVFGNYNYDYPDRSYNYGYLPTKTSIPEIPTVITGGGDNPFWRRHKDESVQQDRQNLKKYHKFSEITGGATAGQAMNLIWGNSTAFYQKMQAQGAGEGKLTVDKKTKSRKKTTKKSSAKNSKSPLHPILFETLI